MNALAKTIHFDLPKHLSCPKPTELRGLARDEVRLLVTTGQGEADHTIFKNLDHYLNAGDVLVVNTSATRASAIPIELSSQTKGVVHFSTPVNNREWLVEIREIVGNKTLRWSKGNSGMEIMLPGNSRLKLKRKFYKERELLHLWVADFDSDLDYQLYLEQHARPIKYDMFHQSYPLDYYQSFFSLIPGSAEMPSAGRGFTNAMVDKLLAKGVIMVPVLLHSGVSSLEENETPYPEYVEIDPVAAATINHARRRVGRIVAVGTTVVRALETAALGRGELGPFRGQTELHIDEAYQMKITDALLTGFHEPKASHLHMLQSLAGYDHIEKAYHLAINRKYSWHQFGDLHLILP